MSVFAERAKQKTYVLVLNFIDFITALYQEVDFMVSKTAIEKLGCI